MYRRTHATTRVNFAHDENRSGSMVKPLSFSSVIPNPTNTDFFRFRWRGRVSDLVVRVGLVIDFGTVSFVLDSSAITLHEEHFPPV